MTRTILRESNWWNSRWVSFVGLGKGPRGRWYFVSVFVFALVFVAYVLRWWPPSVGVINLDDEVPDPAIEFTTKARSADFGGIDRWAYPGLEAGRVAGRLKQRDYECPLPQEPQVGGTPKSGSHKMVCTRDVSWPVSRKLQIEAAIDYDAGGRLASAKASSIVAAKEGSMRTRWAKLLRKAGLIEPAELAVEGLSFGSVDALAQFVADALNPNGWHASCARDPIAARAPRPTGSLGLLRFFDPAPTSMCEAYARDRRASGFRPLPAGPLSVPDVASLRRELARIGFAPHRVPRIVLIAPRITPLRQNQEMLVRLADGRMWLDFDGRDLAGRDRTLSVEVESEGGAMVQMVITQGTASKVMPLAGARRQTPQQAMFLAPEASPYHTADGDYRDTIWITVSRDGRPASLEYLSRVLRTVDPTFIPRILRPVLADTSSPPGAALDAIDGMADKLRLAGVPRSMHPGQSGPSILQAYPDNPAARAAWALALCEKPEFPSPRIDPACWLNFTSSDPEAAALLRREIAILQPEYRKLEPSNPKRLRLQRLSDAFAQP